MARGRWVLRHQRGDCRFLVDPPATHSRLSAYLSRL